MKNTQVRPQFDFCTRKTFRVIELLSTKSSYGRLLALQITCGILLLLVATSMASAANTFKTLISFNGTDGRAPNNEFLTQGRDGDLYGTTEYGGAHNFGSVFKISSGGALTTLWSFCATANCPDGAYPIGGLALGTNGNFYGTTYQGGNGYGTIFEITPAGALTTLYKFCHALNCPDGLNPTGALLLASDGNFYGTTILGGVGGCGGCHGGGVAFKLTPAGLYTKIHDFCTGTCTDYGNPSNPLVQGNDGAFYSVISGRSGFYDGNVFKMTPNGTVTILYKFCTVASCPDGVFPGGPLAQGTDGNFYGTTANGGKSNNGTFFKITPAGKLTTLHSFGYETAGNLGADTTSGVTLANDGNFYGTASQGGTDCVFGCGTIFKMTSAGALTTLHEFVGADGSAPWGIIQETGGSFYGVNPTGGGSNYGTVYSLGTGLGAFAKLVTTHGKVGSTVEILGQGFTGTIGVSFDGVNATFDNVSDTYMTATVPTGALTGTITVTTLTTSYKSSQIYHVLPQFTAISPAGGTVGSTVTLTGVSLTQTTTVTIGGKAASFKVVSDTEVTATVPAGAKTGQPIGITTAGGAVNFGTFAVEPNITNFTPTSGPVGTEVTVNGTTFTGATQITFNSVAATSFAVINDSQMKAIVPAGAATGKIEVTTPGGTGTSSSNFIVQ